jgi:DNA-binding NtrC family response regulator
MAPNYAPRRDYLVKVARKMVDVAAVGNGYPGARAALAVGGAPVRIDSESGGLRTSDDRFGRMIGRSPAMQTVFDLLGKAAPSDATILLEGETGTGKEVSAEAIHRGSPRATKPFLVVDCGAMPPQLLESELFGHERGAFTGAVSARQGVFEAAGGGTVFLDEIGELSLDLQPKLLRVLERREVRRVGTNNHIPVNVRLIAATNRSLREQVAAQKFRSDLYYRLAVVEVRLPPLRERLPDLPLLVDHIVRAFGTVDETTWSRVRAPEFLEALARHSWPGNIRELRNYLERCLALHDFAAPRSVTDSSAAVSGPESAVNIGQPLREAREAWVGAFERRYLEELLRQHENRVSSAARAAGVDRIYFYRLLWKHGLRTREPSLREPDDVA